MESSQAEGGARPLEPVEQELLAHLIEQLSAALDPRALRQRGEAGLREVALEALTFLERLRPGELAVRVWNPGGSRRDRTVLEVLIRDQPFLVDTLRLNLRRLGLREMLLLHPVLAVERDESGAVKRVGKGTGTRERESFLYAEVPGIRGAAECERVEEELRRVFEEVTAVVADHARMVKALREHTAGTEFAAKVIGDLGRARKLKSFLDWLADENFIFLGYRYYDASRDGEEWRLQVGREPGLGLMRDRAASRFDRPLAGGAIPRIVRSRLSDHRLVYFDKSRSESTVHRTGRLDSVSIKTLDEQGRTVGFGRFLGLLTHKAVRTPGSEIPLLRERLQEVLGAIGAEPGSHIYKAAIEAYDSLPVEFLFPFDVGSVTSAVQRILTATEELQVEVFVVPDPLNRAFFVAVTLPRRSYDENMRTEIVQFLVDRAGATYVDHRSSFLDEEVAVIHLFCSSAEDVAADQLAALEAEIKARVTSWTDRFEAALLEELPAERAYRLADEYGAALPGEYRLTTPPNDAVRDVAALERIRGGECDVELALAGDEGRDDTPETWRLKVYQRRRPYLTDLLPVLDNFGLRVIDATLSGIEPDPGRTLWITSFRIESLNGAAPEGRGTSGAILEGLRAALAGRAENDALNRLIHGVGVPWPEVDVLRAYLAYAAQVGIAPERAFAAETLLRYPEATRALLALFRARFSPELPGERAAAERAAAGALARAREPIPTFTEDRVFRVLANLIGSTLRTSFFAAEGDDASGPHQIAFKVDPSRVEGMPSPRPYAEIFVRSTELVGVHLRGGPIARGGLRWSDRAQGFRAEILGLMKTQMVKNGLIVPVGSKGGFVVKRRFSDAARARTEADRQYARFVRALLRLTDNRTADGIAAPPRVVRRDGDDPYLVVAADKGTAHLSDTANRVAEAEGFWLGDAFASGGTNGYDHKREGITARGAWVCVKRHFLELGRDVDAEPFTVVGIGDMSGDVFGNGMLLARRARLLAAFNHEHVLLDPDPDPEAAWLERKRLFELPHSTWRDYDPARISTGGGVFDRTARAIPLSPEARTLLGTDAEQLSGEELIRSILRLPADLLWNGGIGTYVKARAESDADVGDRANAGVRVDACELCARVVGEGGNLGFTQLARVEYALGGGRINTDAIDNSGGVDLSDHEVNFKVLLAEACASGRMSRDERNELLRACLAQASEAVLAHSAAQARCLSLDLLRSERDPEGMVHAAVFLARHAGLDWGLEFLPERDDLRARGDAGSTGYARPELAILLGYTKMLVKRELGACEATDHTDLLRVLLAYFPDVLAERFAAEIERHPLRREITATCLANRVVDQAGVTLVPELVRATGASIAEVVLAFHTVDRLLEAGLLRRAIAEAPVPEAVRLRAGLRVDDAVRSGVRARLGSERRGLLAGDEAGRWTELVRRLRESLPELLGARERERAARAAEALAEEGLPPMLALEIARMPALVGALGVVSLVLDSGAELPRAAEIYTRVGEEAGIAWLLDRLADVSRWDAWDRAAAESLYLDALDVQRALAERVLETPAAGAPAAALRQIRETIREIELDDRGALAPLTVLAQQIRRLC